MLVNERGLVSRMLTQDIRDQVGGEGVVDGAVFGTFVGDAAEKQRVGDKSADPCQEGEDDYSPPYLSVDR